MKPTIVFRPFGENGPKVALYGCDSGDWNVNGLSKSGDHVCRPGLFFRLNRITETFCLSKILMPSPINCNAKICNPEDLTVGIQKEIGSVALIRGVDADGVVLHPGLTGGIATADCPTIIAYCRVSGTTIMAHGGMKSITNGVVDSVIKKAEELRLGEIKVFITCGIAVHSYERVDLAPSLPRECTIGNFIDLRKLISEKFNRYGVYDVTTDTIDTFGDRRGTEFLWHSYRRGKTPADKAGRNLVLVVNI